MAGGQATSQLASGSPRGWLRGKRAARTSKLWHFSSGSLLLRAVPSLLRVLRVKGPLTISVSGREAHRHGAGCEGGWAKVKVVYK